MWRVATLWPNGEAVIGVYDHPPPEGAGIDVIEIDRHGPAAEDFFSREGIKTAEALTKLKDRIRGFLP